MSLLKNKNSLVTLTVVLAFVLILFGCNSSFQNESSELFKEFQNPPDKYRPWVFWHWTNGNVTREGITKDLESMKEVGIGGVITFRLSGPRWAPAGPLQTGMDNQLPMIRFAAEEADRLGLEFSLVADYGYGTGGPHINPNLSMKQVYSSETIVAGGQEVRVRLKQPSVEKVKRLGMKEAWFRPGKSFTKPMLEQLSENDSYRDVAVFAKPNLNQTRLENLESYTGLDTRTQPSPLKSKIPPIKQSEIIDLTDKMDEDGYLVWQSPPGEWCITRFGFASNYKFTRPVPASELGLEADRLSPGGIDAHFDHRLKPVLESVKDGQLIDYIFLDSWEAGSQNWTEGFEDIFKKLRGYDPRPWLPALTGQIVENADLTDRFLWDFRQTIDETMMTAYTDRLIERLDAYGVKYICQSYGNFCADNLSWAAKSAFPIGEFWSKYRKIPEIPGTPAEINDENWRLTWKGYASTANALGRSRVGAEAFTGARGWSDHPYLIKGMGDIAFSEGISHYIFHLSAHQPYDNIRPGLTHSRWGEHFNRHQTWWQMSKPYMQYVARSQVMLQSGRRVVDVATLFNEGAPLYLRKVSYEIPEGYDFDIITPEILQDLRVENGLLVLPSGVSYHFLEVVPTRLTLATAQKIEALRKAGAKIYTRDTVEGTRSLVGYPESNQAVQQMAAEWQILPKGAWPKVLKDAGLPCDFEGGFLKWLHRKTDEYDIYFVANSEYASVTQTCVFRIKGLVPELWNPETGERTQVRFRETEDGRTSIDLEFHPAQSWFVVFRDASTATVPTKDAFQEFETVRTIEGKWTLEFDPDWGTDQTQQWDELISWTESMHPLIKYYSGTASYRHTFEFDGDSKETYFLDLGQVEVIARVTLNGKDVGIAWKPPYRLDISSALKKGMNDLQVDVVNTWNNRLVGDEQLPLDSKWESPEVLLEWPEWFPNTSKRTSGRYTMTTNRHYNNESPLQPSGLLGPVNIKKLKNNE